MSKKEKFLKCKPLTDSIAMKLSVLGSERFDQHLHILMDFETELSNLRGDDFEIGGQLIGAVQERDDEFGCVAVNGVIEVN